MAGADRGAGWYNTDMKMSAGAKFALGALLIVGSVGYCPAGKGNPAIFPPDWAAVLLLAVSPSHRGHGIARKLVSACIQCARNDSAQVIGLFTSELMTAAQQLYESCGFRRESELPPRFGLRYWRYKLPLTEAPLLARMEPHNPL